MQLRTVWTRKITSLNAYIRREERTKISNLSAQHKSLEKESKLNPKQREEMILIEAKSVKLSVYFLFLIKPNGGPLKSSIKLTNLQKDR